MSDITRFIDDRIPNSITSLTPSLVPVDNNEPLSFIDWAKYSGESISAGTEEYLARYSSYLNNWFIQKKISTIDSQVTIQKLYISLINDIVINYSTVDEQRFLKNVDPTSQRDLAAAVPFFAKKLKDICLYYSTLRDKVQYTAIANNLNGSNYGIQKLIYNAIIETVTTDDYVRDISSLFTPISTIKNDTVIEVEDIYDTYSNYYDITPTLPSSAYGSSNDIRSKYFNLNQYNIDPYLFLNINESVLRAIFQYPFYLIELGENLTIDPAVNSSQLGFLKDNDYTKLINIENQEALNLIEQRDFVTKFIGTDFYYIQTNSSGTVGLSGILFESESEFANVLNKRYPSIAAIPSEEFLKTGKELGLFFKPDKQGLLHFTNFKFTPILKDGLEPNTVYYFPDPSKYGNITSNTQQDFKTPFAFREENHFNKIDFSNQYAFGDVRSDSQLHTFRAYQSREQSLNISNFGVVRYTDPQEFFKGEKKNIWANSDVYPLIPANLFPIDERIQKQLPINKTLIQYKSDIYGNDYGLYKDVEPYKVTQELNKTAKLPFQCLVLDGHLFYDSISGYNFNYNVVDDEKGYSGIILKTATSTLNNTPSGTGMFSLSSVDYTIISYDFQPESFCSNYIDVKYDCNIKDGQTFTLSNDAQLPDVPTDSPSYDPGDAGLYYQELVDGGVSHLNLPTYRATFAYPGEFTYTPPFTSIGDYDGSFYFVANSGAPCGAESAPTLYTETSFFLDYHIPLRETVIDTVSSHVKENRTIYDAEFRVYGDLYFRRASDSEVIPLSSALSAIFIKYNYDIQREIYNKVINFDIYYDTLLIETENYAVFDAVIPSPDGNTIYSNTGTMNAISKGTNINFEKLSTVWFDEVNNNLLVCKMCLLPDLSASNYKIVYPKVFLHDIGTKELTQVYPQERDEALTFDMLRGFSLIDKNIELNIVEIDKPILTYNIDTDIYKLTYVGRDVSCMFYIFVIEFAYINGTVVIKTQTMYMPTMDVLNLNFSNPTFLTEFDNFATLGTRTGSIDESDNAFVWGHIDPPVPYITFQGEYIVTEDGLNLMYTL
jgi:hypothetical protein